MSNKVKTTIINDRSHDKLSFLFEFNITDLLVLDLNEHEMIALKEAGESNDSLRLIRTLASIVETLEKKTIGDLNGKG